MANLFRAGSKIINLDHVGVVNYRPAAGGYEGSRPSQLTVCMETSNDEIIFGVEADLAWDRLCAITINPPDGARDYNEDLEAMNQKLSGESEPTGDNFPHITEGGYPA